MQFMLLGILLLCATTSLQGVHCWSRWGLNHYTPVTTSSSWLTSLIWPPKPPEKWKATIAQRLDAEDYSNDAPLIGVLTEPCSGRECDFGKSVVAGPVVEWIHSAGGRAVPIRYYDSDEWLEKMFRSVNGIVFPGGAVRLWWDSPYFVAASKLFNMAMEANKNGTVFPVMGICLGFELLHVLLANESRHDLLIKTDAEGYQEPLRFTSKASSSLMYRSYPPQLKYRLASKEYSLAYMAHVRGVAPTSYATVPKLGEFFDILATSVDPNGVEYISAVEGIHAPVFATQYHPEKPPHEFADPTLKHTRDTAALGFYAASHFVDIARLNDHKVTWQEQLDIVMYNWRPSFTARAEVYKLGPNPDVLYFIDPPSQYAGI